MRPPRGGGGGPGRPRRRRRRAPPPPPPPPLPRALLLLLCLCLFLASASAEEEEEEEEDGEALGPGAACGSAPPLAPRLAALRLPFCAAYSLGDLLRGMARPEGLDCAALLPPPAAPRGPPPPPPRPAPPLGDWGPRCAACLEAYLRLDAHAREKHAEFAALLARLPQARDPYSVRACLHDCQAAYKAWLCSEYFHVAQLQCAHRVPCHQYCLAVQSKCPFVLPDNDQLIYGGLPGFLCTGLMETPLPEQEAKCCALQWDSCGRRTERGLNASSSTDASEPFDGHPPHSHQQQHQQQHYHLYYHHHPAPPPPPSQPPPLLPVSAGSRLGPSSRVRLGLLLLILLHTVVSFSGGGGGGSGDREAGGGRGREE